jgi:hypothetical protein
MKIHIFHKYEEIIRAELAPRDNSSLFSGYAILKKCKICGKEKGMIIIGGQEATIYESKEELLYFKRKFTRS